MRFYSVHCYEPNGSHGYVWFTNKSEARKAMREWRKEETDYEADLDVVDVKPTKEGILRLLRHHASHPNNG